MRTDRVCCPEEGSGGAEDGGRRSWQQVGFATFLSSPCIPLFACPINFPLKRRFLDVLILTNPKNYESYMKIN
jgi:hypothetical protein